MRWLALTLLLPALAAGAEPPSSSTPLSPGWAPLIAPTSVLLPGLGHLLRGERKAGGIMLGAAGIATTVSAGAAAFLIFSGASDVSAAVGIPLLLTGVSTLLLLAIIDWVGTFAGDGAPHTVDSWSARFRIAASVLAPMRAGSPASPELIASHRGERWLIQARARTTVNGPGTSVEGGAGVRVFGYSAHEPRAGLWLEAGLRYEWFDATRLLRARAQLVSTLPMGVFAPRLARLTTLFRLGVDPTWVWYSGRSGADVELPLSGGFEARVVITEPLRLFAGYEHSRDGALGGLATGFLGNFYGGAELSLFPSFVVFARATAGTPNGFTLGLEWRQ
ncbi:MAG: hypothetical protein JNK82_05860 [Myxococcaceae bacterium]|nr:hypothetical protein [Myxococcaceae bacterium]